MQNIWPSLFYISKKENQHRHPNDVQIEISDGYKVSEGQQTYPDEEKGGNCCAKATSSVQKSISAAYAEHKQTVKVLFYILIILLYFAYFTYAIYYSFGDEPSVRLLVCTILIVFLIVGKIVLSVCESTIDRYYNKSIRPCTKSKSWHTAKRYLSLWVENVFINFIW